MLPDKWIPSSLLVKSGVCAVEICHGDEGVIYYYTHIKTKNNKLELAATGFSEGGLQLPENIRKNKVPLVLVINGRGVMIRKIELNADNNDNAEELMKKYLPGVNSVDFYVQVYRQENHTAFMALCRKEQLDQDLRKINETYDVAGISLGAAAIMGLKPLWEHCATIPLNLYTAELTNNSLDNLNQEVRTETTSLKIEDLTVPLQHTLGFAAGLNYLLQLQIADNSDAHLTELENRHIEKNKLRALVMVAVGIAFLLAIVNVVFYTSYFDKNNRLESELSLYQGKYDKINELLNDYQKNKQLIEHTGILSKNRLSEYGDRIGQTIPKEITLSELYFNPENKDIDSEDSLLTFRNNLLILKGNCAKSFIVNEWVNVLKMQNFVRSVNLEKYTYNTNNEGLMPNFEISLVTQ